MGGVDAIMINRVKIKEPKRRSTASAVNSNHRSDGRFAPGNQLSKTRECVGSAMRFRNLMLETVSERDWREIIKTAVEFAKQGDRHARSFLADRLLGRVPFPIVELDPQEYTADERYL
jgi:hypothetical protein